MRHVNTPLAMASGSWWELCCCCGTINVVVVVVTTSGFNPVFTALLLDVPVEVGGGPTMWQIKWVFRLPTDLNPLWQCGHR